MSIVMLIIGLIRHFRPVIEDRIDDYHARFPRRERDMRSYTPIEHH